MRQLAWILLTLLFLLASPAVATPVDLEIRYRSDEIVDGFVPVFGIGIPPLNDVGTLAFLTIMEPVGGGVPGVTVVVNTAPGASSVVARDGDGTHALIDSGLGIDAASRAVFRATPAVGGPLPAIFAAGTGGGTEVANANDPGEAAVDFGQPVVSNAGPVVFPALDPPNVSLLRDVGAGPGVPVFDPATAGVEDLLDYDVNAVGDVAYRALLDGGGTAVFLARPASAPVIVATAADFAAEPAFLTMGEDGNVYVNAEVVGGQSGIFRIDETAIANVIDLSGPFEDVGRFSVNGSGEIVFEGAVVGGASGLFNGPDPVTDALLVEGDAVLGGTLGSVRLGSDGLNASGQFAFSFTLENDPLQGLGVGQILAEPDADLDGVPDAEDNCVDEPNADQADLDAGQDDDSSLGGIQHYGDACDADLDNDGLVAAGDFFGVLRPCLGADLVARPSCVRADLDGDGAIGASDFFARFRPALGAAPGPGVTE